MHNTNNGSKAGVIAAQLPDGTGTSVATTGLKTSPGQVAPQLQAAINELGGIGAKVPGTKNTVGACCEFNAANPFLLRRVRILRSVCPCIAFVLAGDAAVASEKAYYTCP